MNPLLRCAAGGAAFAILALLGVAPAQDQPDPNDIPDGVEIQTRGPVHEAFAQPFDMKPEPGQLVPKAPPAPVPEEPPPERPEGANVQFIPGYWAWDPEDQRFLWVSGGYRNVPAGRQWVPGYWTQVEGGWRWVPGLWAPEQQQEMRYTPEPPAPLDVEPSYAAPSDDATWIPGTWVYRDTRFAWRPGYWSPFRLGRVWVRAHYHWTPYGYTFADGYWDYPWENRGLLFAPVYFHRPFWHTAGWYWRPWYVVNSGLFYDSCFHHRGSFHLYFGNYYGARYAGYGFSPWFSGYGRYDPAFGYYRWRNGHDHNWYGHQRRLYDDRFAGRASVPPRTFAQQRNNVGNVTVVNNNHVNAVAPLSQAKNLNKNVNLVRLSGAQIDTQKAFAKRTQEIAQTRNFAAAKVGGVSSVAPGKQATTTLKLPPLVQGTQPVRPGVESSAKNLNPAKGASPGVLGKNPATGGAPKDGRPSFDTGAKPLTKSAPFNAPGGNPISKNTTPNVNNEFKPGTVQSKPPPKTFKTPDATPRSPDFKQPSQPRTIAPSTGSGNLQKPAPRGIEAPKNSAPSTVRFGDASRLTAPPKSQNFSAPRNSAPAPRMTSPPSSTPRFSAPSPSPRFSAPSAPQRSSPANNPRSGGKGGMGRDE